MLRRGFRYYGLPIPQSLAIAPWRAIDLLPNKRVSPARHLTYWYRPHTSKTRHPVLFIHGIGIGLWPYSEFFAELTAAFNALPDEDGGQVGILAIEIMPIAFRLTHAALLREQVCAEIQAILDHHNMSNLVLVSHSYGSVITTHMLQTRSLRSRISSLVLVDPVTLLLHLPDVAYNFTCRMPTHANEWQLWYFASKDIGVAHTLGRRFFWSENILWKEDLEGLRTTVSLASRDLIVNTRAVGRYLTNGVPSDAEIDTEKERIKEYDEDWKERTWQGEGVEVLWFEGLDHAQVFDRRWSRKRLVDVIKVYCDAASSATQLG